MLYHIKREIGDPLLQAWSVQFPLYSCPLLVLALGCADAIKTQAQIRSAPVTRVVQLLAELEVRVTNDGRVEQKSYDKYACWCEDTLARKASDIANGKQTAIELQELIYNLNAEIAAHGAEIEQLKKDIVANIDAQKDATDVRNKENSDYNAEKTESEQCIGALEAAVNVLTGAGTGKKTLATLQEAQVLSVVAGIRRVISLPTISNKASGQELETVRRFVEHPEEFTGGHGFGFLSAAQIAQNPFGDYAPQSTQIQGILKGMYDAFTADLEKDNADEANSQKSYEEFMAVKKKELATLKTTLEKQMLDHATKSKLLADSEENLDNTKAQLEADEAFFAQTKEGCQLKASEWAERSRLRTEELQSIKNAIVILSSPEAKRTFHNASTTFVQVSAVRQHLDAPMLKAYRKLAKLATTFRSISLAEIAVQAKSTGHFDKVIASIDAMIEVLRKEEQDDIAHRDRCEGAEFKNKIDMEDLNSDISKTEKTIEHMKNREKELKATIATLEGDIEITKSDMEALLKMRNKEHAEFVQALKDDVDAVKLIEEAIVAVSKFYKDNGIPLEYLQKPAYTIDNDTAPETVWDGPDYQGRQSETGGIVAILSMIKEDFEKEIQEGRKDDADAQATYEKDRGAMQATLDEQLKSKMTAEKQLADLQAKIGSKEDFKAGKAGDLDGETKLKGALDNDCAWVKTHFDSRRSKRKVEIAGLQEAKDYLAGVEAGSELSP